MPHDSFLRRSFVSLEVNETFSEAVLVMTDDSRLRFHHVVGERWARAEGARETEASLAGQILSRMARFRLNARHLEVLFDDGSRWEARFDGSGGGQRRANAPDAVPE